MGVEIERKFLITKAPFELDNCEKKIIEQAYLCQSPVVRVRRSNDKYYMTYKGQGLLEREEYNLPLTKESYEHLRKKADGHVIKKVRHLIPLEITRDIFPNAKDEDFEEFVKKTGSLLIELDVFSYPENLVMAEVEFPDRKMADEFTMPSWFKQEVTNDPKYHNVNMI